MRMEPKNRVSALMGGPLPATACAHSERVMVMNQEVAPGRRHQVAPSRRSASGTRSEFRLFLSQPACSILIQQPDQPTEVSERRLA